MHNLAYFFSFFWKPVFSKKNLLKQILTTPFIYVFISLCVNKSLSFYNYMIWPKKNLEPSKRTKEGWINSV